MVAEAENQPQLTATKEMKNASEVNRSPMRFCCMPADDGQGSHWFWLEWLCCFSMSQSPMPSPVHQTVFSLDWTKPAISSGRRSSDQCQR